MRTPPVPRRRGPGLRMELPPKLSPRPDPRPLPELPSYCSRLLPADGGAFCPAEDCFGLFQHLSAVFMQGPILLGQFVGRILHYFPAALVKVLTLVHQLLTRIDQVIRNFFSLAAQSPASACAWLRRHQQCSRRTDRGSQKEQCCPGLPPLYRS